MTTDATSDEDRQLDARWTERNGLLFKAWTQVRYQRRRQRYFDLLDKGTKAVTIVLGMSLLGSFVSNFFPWLGAAITSIGLLALVFGYGDRKQLHKELAEQAASLVASIESVPLRDLTADNTAGWAADYARLCAKAPPPLKTLTLMCEREQSVADGNPNHVAAQPLRKRMFADLMN